MGELIAIPEGRPLAGVFSGEHGQIDDLLAEIRRAAMSEAPDLTTATGRKRIASLAYRVSQTKAALDAAGKALTADMKKRVAAVDADRKKIRNELDAVRDDVRAPLTQWETEEERRKAELAARMSDLIELAALDSGESSTALEARIAQLQAIRIDDTWGERQENAAKVRAGALANAPEILEAARKREADEAELAQLRKEAAERQAAEASERKRKAAAEREVARAAAAERERQEIAERERRAAAARAARDIAEAQARAEAAERRASEAAAAEKRKIEAEQERKRQRELARQRDVAHRVEIATDIARAIHEMGFSQSDAKKLTRSLMAGEIPHVEVKL